jgi:hypothetical protein
MLQIKHKNGGSRAEWLVDSEYTFGTGADSNYKVGGASHEATLKVDGDNLTLFNVSGSDEVKVNGARVKREAHLGADDEFSIGDADFQLLDPKALRAKSAPSSADKSDDGTGWSLKALNTALANKSFPLDATQSIGRANDCDICLNVVHLSRRHAQITVKDGYLQVNDLNSSNGTFLNGKKMSSARVRSGDELAFDTLKFEVFGPNADVEKTSMRMASVGEVDGDQTTMRAAISAEALKPTVEKKKPSGGAAKVQPEKPKPQAATPVSQSSDKPQGMDGSTKFMLLAVGLIVAAGAAYFIFLG